MPHQGPQQQLGPEAILAEMIRLSQMGPSAQVDFANQLTAPGATVQGPRIGPAPTTPPPTPQIDPMMQRVDLAQRMQGLMADLSGPVGGGSRVRSIGRRVRKPVPRTPHGRDEALRLQELARERSEAGEWMERGYNKVPPRIGVFDKPFDPSTGASHADILRRAQDAQNMGRKIDPETMQGLRKAAAAQYVMMVKTAKFFQDLLRKEMKKSDPNVDRLLYLARQVNEFSHGDVQKSGTDLHPEVSDVYTDMSPSTVEIIKALTRDLDKLPEF